MCVDEVDDCVDVLRCRDVNDCVDVCVLMICGVDDRVDVLIVVLTIVLLCVVLRC